jgi:hypothetical protein
MASGNEKLEAFFAATEAKSNAARDKSVARHQKKLDRKFAGRIRRTALPVAAGTEGIAKGAAKVFEGTRKEAVIHKSQGDAAKAAINTKSVQAKSANGPVGRMLARRVVKKNVKRGMKEGGEVARQMLGAAAKDNARRNR